ncbi:ATP phosphoribosyltransferase [Acetobacter indonesiensis]|uniref:ATP phosphoribosyltransferase n=1 Tax=Acetobacter indonesiensis TaxID=104101 RepID=A0A252AXR7_9PROT|nr:ATP phosphoribosyltransferase [Acetobacter indonesiensis]OUI96337.1 ATP phosphoribosyltransferase catalytic subunit [Acetobacter indonesiensis]
MTVPQPDLQTVRSSGTETRGPLVLALPKGRILKAVTPLLAQSGCAPSDDCLGDNSRKLRFPTQDPQLDVVRVRSFDVATFVASGGAQIGICGADVLMEFDYPEIYAPLDLGIGGCRISIAQPKELPHDPAEWARWSEVRAATKYPAVTRRYFAARGINANIVHLHGAMELAPMLGLSRLIVDLVDTGSTLRANGLREVETIAHVTSRLIVNRTALKTRPEEIAAIITRFRAALEATAKQTENAKAEQSS